MVFATIEIPIKNPETKSMLLPVKTLGSNNPKHKVIIPTDNTMYLIFW
jgi:hypothetical protein